MANLEAKISKLIKEMNFSMEYADEDFFTIVGSVKSWLNFSSKPVNTKQTLKNKDPWNY